MGEKHFQDVSGTYLIKGACEDVKRVPMLHQLRGHRLKELLALAVVRRGILDKVLVRADLLRQLASHDKALPLSAGTSDKRQDPGLAVAQGQRRAQEGSGHLSLMSMETVRMRL